MSGDRVLRGRAVIGGWVLVALVAGVALVPAVYRSISDGPTQAYMYPAWSKPQVSADGRQLLVHLDQMFGDCDLADRVTVSRDARRLYLEVRYTAGPPRGAFCTLAARIGGDTVTVHLPWSARGLVPTPAPPHAGDRTTLACHHPARFEGPGFGVSTCG
ncbi:MAG: hypothetical protein JWN46_1605 [Acidimicrobiales bacterium]|nr:hypothetical protein [Acidimicrobiales bacterium]